MPNCSPIRFNAPVRVAGSRRATTAIRVARSRSSSGYFLGAVMTLIPTWIESLHQTRHGTGSSSIDWCDRARPETTGSIRVIVCGDVDCRKKYRIQKGAPTSLAVLFRAVARGDVPVMHRRETAHAPRGPAPAHRSARSVIAPGGLHADRS